VIVKNQAQRYVFGCDQIRAFGRYLAVWIKNQIKLSLAQRAHFLEVSITALVLENPLLLLILKGICPV